jgi:hypothetical protein
MKWMFQMGRGGKAVQVSESHGRLTEARTGKEIRGSRRVRGPRVTRATAGYPERDSSRYILNGVSFNTAKFKPNQPYTATIVIEKGCHKDHGTAIFFEQGTRRCLLTDTLYGLTDDEALWYTMQAWAKFQPRKAKPRQDPGLYYPAEYSHVFQKYWDVLNDPVTHPNCDESDHTKRSMREMATALKPMSLDSLEPLVDAEASDKSCRVPHNAALSRRCPIQDAVDYWQPVEAQVECVTDLGGPAPVQDCHNVDT